MAIADTGPGIDEALGERMFEPYRQGPEPGLAGTGLGLYIARELVESNKAQISYSAVDPHGSNFKIFFANQISQESNK